MFRAKQLSLSGDSGAGTPFSRAWGVARGLEAKEVWLPGVDKVVPTSFSAKKFELLPILSLMSGE